MSRILFAPVSITGGLIAGLFAKKIFDFVWGLVDDEEPPAPKDRETNWPKLLAALVVQGAIFKAMRGFADRSSRKGFYRLTGSWPGEKRPDAA